MKQIEVPWGELSEEALAGVLEEFVTREGTEYGRDEVSLEAKMAAVRAQLAAGEVALLFDAETGTTNLVLRRDLP